MLRELGTEPDRLQCGAYLDDPAEQTHEGQEVGRLDAARGGRLEQTGVIERRKGKGTGESDDVGQLPRDPNAPRPFAGFEPGKGREDFETSAGAAGEGRDELLDAVELERRS